MQRTSLTEVENKMYNIIVQYIEEKQYSPSMRELTEITEHKSTATVHSIINRIIAKGYITKEPSSPRTLRVVDRELIKV